jgi:hypothetical protein
MRLALILSLIICALVSAAPTRARFDSRISLEGMTPSQVVQVVGKPFSEDIAILGGRPMKRWIYKGTTFDTRQQIWDRTVVNYEILFLDGRAFSVIRHAPN